MGRDALKVRWRVEGLFHLRLVQCLAQLLIEISGEGKPITICFSGLAKSDPCLSLGMAARMLGRRLHHTVGQEVNMADVVEDEIELWALLGFAALDLRHQVLRDQGVLWRVVVNTLKEAVVFEPWTLLAKRYHLWCWLGALSVKPVHYRNLVVDIRGARFVVHVDASLVQLVCLSLHIDVPCRQAPHACLIVWAALAHEIASPFFLGDFGP